MKLEIGKSANTGFAACGHAVLEGERVLVLEHDARTTMVCLHRHCAGAFVHCDDKLDELKVVDAKTHAKVVARAEQSASKAGAEKQAEWDEVDAKVAQARHIADRTRKAAAAYQTISEDAMSDGGEVDRSNPSPDQQAAETRHTNALRAQVLAERVRDHHHTRERTPAFHAACAWLDAVRKA